MLTSVVLAVLFGCLVPLLLVFLFVSLLRGDSENVAIAGLDVVAAGAFALFMWRQSRLQVIADETGLHVVNYLSTFDIAWDSIECFDSSFRYSGIGVMMKDGSVVALNASTKWNVPIWLNRRTRADEIAAELNERLAASGR